MRILWLLNICPPAVGKALGLECSVREGWITGALNRFLAGGREGKGRAGEDMGVAGSLEDARIPPSRWGG